MTIASCPRCSEEVTLPHGGQEDSRVACPLCREEFLLGDVLQELPPALILLDAPVDPGEDEDPIVGVIQPEDDPVSEEVPSDGSGDADEEGAADEPDVSGDDAAGAFNFGEQDAAGSTNVSSIRSSRTTSRKAENPVLTMVKVAMGGMLAFPLAQLILWWLPGSWSRDPMHIGPKASQYIPWVVPKRYHLSHDDDSRSYLDDTIKRGFQGEGSESDRFSWRKGRDSDLHGFG